MVSAVLEGKAAHIYNLQNIYSWSYDGGTKTRQFNNMLRLKNNPKPPQHWKQSGRKPAPLELSQLKDF